MTDQNNKSEEPTAPSSDVDPNGIPILNDVVEERDEIKHPLKKAVYYSASVSSGIDPIAGKPATDISTLKETLREELSNELNKLIQTTLLNAAEEISEQVGEIIEHKLSDALQKQMGEMLKTALEERFKNNNSC